MPPLPTLVCKQCGYVNEGERVYCHGCGVKLDRDVIAAVEKKAPSLEQKRREVQKIMSPRRGMFGRIGNNALRTAIIAALVASVLCAIHAPEGAVAPDAKKELTDTPPLHEMLEGFMLMPASQRRALGQKDINTYLRNERFRKVPSWFTDAIPLQRVYVTLEEGSARLTVGGTLLGYPLYAGWTGYFQPGNGGLSAVCTGGFIGRLPVHPKLAQLALPALPLVVSSAERDWKLIQRLRSVQFSNERAILETQGAAPVAPPVAAPPKPVAAPQKAASPTPANRFGTPSPLQGGFR